MSDSSPTPPKRRRLLRGAAIAGALLVAYTAFGFFAAPAILRRVLVKNASAALHREVALAAVKVNPLALSVTVEGLTVKHRDGAPFVGWESLYVRLAPLRLIAGDLGIAELRLVRPSFDVGLGADGTLSFQDLLAPEGESAASAQPASKGGGFGVAIGHLAVEEARVRFHDATHRPSFDTTLGPLTIRLDAFRTKGGGDSPYSFTGMTDAGETFRWTGTVRTAPFRSAGTLAFERIALPRYAPYIHDVAPLEVRDGRVSLETRYALEWGSERHVLKVTDGKLTVEQLAVGPRGVLEPPVRLPRVEVTGIEADVLAREAKIGEVAVRGGTVRVLREPDGALELSRMAPPPAREPKAPWKWSIGAVVTSGLAVHLDDRAAPRPVVLPLSDVALRVEQVRSEVDAVSPLALSLAWNERGRISVTGQIQPLGSKGTLRLDAADLDVVPLVPYLEREVAAHVTGGRAGAKLKIAFDASGAAAPRWSVAGDARLDALAVAESGNDALLRWSALELTGIDASSQPPRASVKLIRLVDPTSKVFVWEDGSTSLARALRPPVAAAKPAVGAPAGPAKPAPASGPEWRTAIGEVQVVRGKAVLVDRSVRPAAVLNVTNGEGKVTNLSSDPKVRSTVDVRLQLEGASPVRIAGTLNPLQKEAYTELTVASEGVDLSPLDSYSGKFLGYGIRKGKLDLDLRYVVRNRNLAATNVVKVNQFTLGDHTDSPDATKLPVRLALALLQDNDGVILLDVPVEGNLDDPEFHLGKVIWHTVLNVLAKVATSPFRALAALAGGAHADLSMVEFAPGTAEPLPAAQDQLATLGRSLAQRPAVALEVEGSADPERDGPALRQAALERSLRSAKAATQSPPTSAEAVTLTPDERARLVRAAYEAAFPAAPKAGDAASKSSAPAAAPLSTQEMEGRLAAAVEVPPDAYRALAAERAERAREALIASGVDQNRLFLTQGGGRADQEKGARVYFTAR
jgi:hypothetical protein